MKTATELREIVTQREAKLAAHRAEKLKEYVESNLAVRMENAAKDGGTHLTVDGDELKKERVEPNALLEYLHGFGLTAHVGAFGVEVNW